MLPVSELLTGGSVGTEKIFNSMVNLLKKLCMAALLLGHAALYAQDANNILGLPAVPQGPGANNSSKKPPILPNGLGEPSEGEIKSMLSGTLGLASSYQNGLVTVRVTTGKAYTGDKTRKQIVQAARLVQRDVSGACGKLCKPAAMPAPRFQPDNTLTFDIVIQGYAGLISTTDMVNLVSGKSISPPTAPVPAPTPIPAAVKPSPAPTAPVSSPTAATTPPLAPSSAAL